MLNSKFINSNTANIDIKYKYAVNVVAMHKAVRLNDPTAVIAAVQASDRMSSSGGVSYVYCYGNKFLLNSCTTQAKTC